MADLARPFLVKLLELNIEEALALAEAWGLLHLSAVAIKTLSFTTIGKVASMGRTRALEPERERQVAVMVTWAVDRAAKRSRWRALCFERGLAAQVMLRRRGLDSTLFYGVGHDAGRVVAHVWVKAAGIDIAGGETAGVHAPLATFPAGRLKTDVRP